MWCTPAPPRPSGSSISSPKLLVPSGVPVHDSCGDTFSPTQLGFGFAGLEALAAFFGSIWPSLKLDEVNANTSAAKAGTAHQDASAIPLANNRLRFNMTSLPLGCCSEEWVKWA